MNSPDINEAKSILKSDIADNETFQKVINEITKYFKVIDKLNINSNQKEEIRYVLTRIGGILFNCTEQNLILSANNLLRYLNHYSFVVRNFAIYGFILILRNATSYVINEESGLKKEELISELTSIINKVENILPSNSVGGILSQEITKVLKYCQLCLFDIASKENPINNNEAYLVNKIWEMMLTCNKNSCIFSATSLLKYLTYKSDIVRQHAASALIIFINVANLTLINEKNDFIIKKLSSDLTDLIYCVEELLNGNNISNDILLKANEALRFAKLAVAAKETLENRIMPSDEYLSTAIKSSVKRLFKSFNVEKYLAISIGKEKVVSQQTVTEFSKSINKIMENLINS